MRFWALATPTQTGQKRCQIEAELKLPKTIKAENTHTDVLVAVDRAANRLARAIIREVTVNETALASASVAKPGAGPVRPRRPLLATKKAKRERMRRKEKTSSAPGTKAKTRLGSKQWRSNAISSRSGILLLRGCRKLRRVLTELSNGRKNFQGIEAAGEGEVLRRCSLGQVYRSISRRGQVAPVRRGALAGRSLSIFVTFSDLPPRTG